MKKYYFDYAAATPLSETVYAAMLPYFTEAFYNPSALYLAAQDVKQALNRARSNVAKALGCKASEIIFTAGGTESDNLAINGVMRRFPDANMVLSAVEHDAVRAPAMQYNHRILPVLPDGRIDIDKLEKLIDGRTVLVSVMYANNEIGAIQPLKEVAKILDGIRKKRSRDDNPLPLYFHADAAQAANYLPLFVNTLGVDMMSLNGGKIYGPKQSGVLFVRTGVRLQPQILGGGQERNLRSGTENVAAAIGFAAALKDAADKRAGEAKRLESLQGSFIKEANRRWPKAIVNGSLKHRLPNNVHVTFPGVDNETLMMRLDERGIMAATGSACSASSEEPSHVLKAIGLSDAEARSSLRFTFGRDTDEKAVQVLLAALADSIDLPLQKR